MRINDPRIGKAVWNAIVIMETIFTMGVNGDEQDRQAFYSMMASRFTANVACSFVGDCCQSHGVFDGSELSIAMTKSCEKIHDLFQLTSHGDETIERFLYTQLSTEICMKIMAYLSSQACKIKLLDIK